MSADGRIADLITLTERLTASLAADAAAFERHRPQDASRGAEETARLANLYRQESARVSRDPHLLSQADPTLRAALIRATETFQTALARHGCAVSAAKTVTEGLVEAIAREVAATRSSPAAYGATARPGPGNLSAITLNRRA